LQMHRSSMQVANDEIRNLPGLDVWDCEESAKAGQLPRIVVAAVGVENHDPARLTLFALLRRAEAVTAFILARAGTVGSTPQAVVQQLEVFVGDAPPMQ